MTELETYIMSYFGVAKSDDIKAIASFFKASSIKKGDYLLQANNRCNALSFVESGLLRMYRLHGGKEITQWISTKGSFTGDISSFLFETPSHSSIHALVDTTILSISKSDYLLIGNVVPQWNEFEKLFTQRCFILMEERIFTHLSMTTDERYEAYFEQNPEIFNQVPLQYLASMLGMTPETFSRVRAKRLQ
jgi:CRP/FNR family transcriptional regulator, anaerobic regulatory protein